MERNIPNPSVQNAGLIRRAMVLIRYWSFPVMVILAWSVAVTYTLAIASARPAAVQSGATSAPPAESLPVVHARAPQQTRGPS